MLKMKIDMGLILSCCFFFFNMKLYSPLTSDNDWLTDLISFVFCDSDSFCSFSMFPLWFISSIKAITQESLFLSSLEEVWHFFSLYRYFSHICWDFAGVRLEYHAQFLYYFKYNSAFYQFWCNRSTSLIPKNSHNL